MKHFFNFELFSEDLVKAFCFLPSDELEGEEKYLYTFKRNKIAAACATCLFFDPVNYFSSCLPNSSPSTALVLI